MLKTLIKKQLYEMFQTYFLDRKTGKARSKKGTVLFFIMFALLFVSLGFAFFGMASGLGINMLGYGFNWLYFALMGLIAIALGVFGSVFNTYASLYLPKDNEFLLSLPIPPKTLLLARLSGVYITSLMYSAWVWIPVLIAYWVIVPLNAANVIFPILLTFVLALFVSVLSCILGWVVALIAVKAKSKSFLTVFLSLAVITVYYVVYFKIVNSLSEILSYLGELESAVRSWLHYVYLVGTAADGNAVSMILVLAITAVLAGLCFFVLSKTFMKFAIEKDNTAKKTKTKNDYTARSAKAALLFREYKHFTSVPTWMLNGGFGLLLLLIAAAAMIIKGDSIREVISQISVILPDLVVALPVLLLASVCLVVSTNVILPVSISVEGRNMWILQSLPIEPWEVLHSKEKMCVQLSAYPTMLFVAVSSYIMQLEILEVVLIACAALAYIWLMADFGLYLNLKSPNFNWTNISYLTKQSMPVLVNLFGGWAFCVALGFGGVYLCEYVSPTVVIAGYTALFSIIFILLHRWLKTKGTEIFRDL